MRAHVKQIRALLKKADKPMQKYKKLYALNKALEGLLLLSKSQCSRIESEILCIPGVRSINTNPNKRPYYTVYYENRKIRG